MLKNLTKSILGDALFAETTKGASNQKEVAQAAILPGKPSQAAQPKRLTPLMLGAIGQGRKSATEPIPFPVKAENSHVLIAGTTGAGKTRVFFQLADQARDRGDKALIVDSGMEQVMRNWRPGDIILNPFDDRWPGWSPFAEFDAPWDAANLARFLIPDGIGSAAEWNGYAQHLLAAILKNITESADSDGLCTETIDEMLAKAITLPLDDLRRFLDGDPITAMLAPDNAKMVSSVRGILSSKLAPFRYMDDREDGGFSLRDWALDDNDKRWVFIAYKDEMLGSLRSLISCWVSLVVMYILSLSENENRRFWLFLDELASLDKIDALTDALTKGRKRGMCVAAGLQAVSQFREKYGDAGAVTLMSNFGTWITLRAGDAETAEAFSKHFGEQEIWQDSFNSGMNVGNGASLNDGASLQLKRQRVVEYTELMRLMDLQAFIKISGSYPAGEICAAIIPPPKDRGSTAFIPARKGKAAYRGRREMKRLEREAVAARKREQEADYTP